MKNVKSDIKHEWMPELRKVHTDSYYSYSDCELAVFNKLFDDRWRIKNKHVDNDYQGETKITLEIPSEFKEYSFSYFWGSCGGCDTLEGDGEEAACQMIYERLQEAINT